ncbi:DoxX family protein [Agrobacterium fabrum]|uniref:DoxX family protein n=1 Tax=Agrobacterium fabrum TaxID=1176649 RepID=UPI00273FC898|nr:DoxX family protein [Agrobacterium fabrum]WLP57498.1 DoxX family protein [Agrobacterium fabrum]
MVSTYIYWISTALLTLLYLASAFMYLSKRDFVKKAQVDLGYSASHLIPFMIVVKIFGPLAILSRINVPLSDLAYAGMFYHLLLSGMAHLGVRKPSGAIPAVIGLVLLFTSFLTQNAVRAVPSAYLQALGF